MTAHDDEFDDFLARVDDVEKTLAGLKSGEIDPYSLDPKIDQVTKEQSELEARRARKKAEAEAKAREAAEERRRKEEYREAHKEELEQLKQDYYLRKAKRERWEQFRAQNKSRAFTDYYRGWDLFEEDPDEELFRGDTPAAVQDQAAFDAMAKDVEERTQRRREQKAACDKEREAGNLAFKAGQYTEALAAYSRAAEHFKGDKAVYANRSLAHLKLRNALSALEDASRAIEIAKFLDEDHDRRPPPKGLVKAYVRRALACGELGRWEEGLKDLDEAAGMAAEGEQPEIRRHAKTLRDDWAAARAEEEQLAAATPPDAAAGDGDDDSTAPAASGPQRVRDLVDELRAAAAAPAAAPSADDGRGAALRQLGATMGAPACRVVLRQAGGLALLVELLPSDAPPVAAILLDACVDRRNQLELHRCGGVSFALRALRRLTPAAPAAGDGEAAESSDDVAAASAVPAAAAAELAPLLHLLARCCAHEKVLEAARPLAASEGAADRLVRLLGSEGAPAPLHAAAAAAVAALAQGGAKGKAPFVAHAPQLCASLVRLIGGGTGDRVVEQAVTAVGNLSTHGGFRKELVLKQAALPALIAVLSAKLGPAARAVAVPNALAALHNLALLPEAAEALATEKVAEVLLAHLAVAQAAAGGGGSAVVARRAMAVLAKAAARNAAVVSLILKRNAVRPVADTLVRVAADAAPAAAPAAPAAAPAAPETSEEVAEAEEGQDLLGACVRVLASCAADEAGARAVCDAGALPVLCTLLGRAGDSGLQGNAALCIGECAREPRCLAVLAVQHVVPPLLAIAHEQGGGAQKNAAIALGRLAKNPHCLQAIRDNHGIEILGRFLPKMK